MSVIPAPSPATRLPGFKNEPLTDMVALGAVSTRHARLWIRSEQTGRLAVSWWPEGEEHQTDRATVTVSDTDDRTCAVWLPDDLDAGAPLTPARRYRYRVEHVSDGHLVGAGHFDTAPDRPEDVPARFAVAVMSCNQPFAKDGSVLETSRQMLVAARRCLEAHNTRMVFMVGDQMYADSPSHASLFEEDYFAKVAPPGRRRILDCTAEEVRRLYWHRYRHFWNLPGWKTLQAEFPCYLILDDHDIVDNWGSVVAHRHAEWWAVGEGARQAYYDYQGSRVLPGTGDKGGVPDSFHYACGYGPAAAFVMDLRSKRTAGPDGRLFDATQQADLEAFLHDHQDEPVLFLVLSVPAIHLPERLARMVSRLPISAEDFSDRWSSGAHRRDRETFLRLLYEHQGRHPSQRIVLLSGDIHIACAHTIQWDNGQVFHQLISSAITHATSPLISGASNLLIRMNRKILTDENINGRIRLLKGEAGKNRNPYGGLNLGLVEIETPEPGAPPSLRFHIYGHKGEEPVCVYRSPAF